MSEETTRNFWEVMRSFQWQDPEPISYRLYYDEAGSPLFYTMEALPGVYIEVDPETYAKAPHNVRVENGRFIVLQPKTSVTKLRQDPDHGTPCDPRDVCVVVDPMHAHNKWNKTFNDID